ncbi:MAG: phage terminase large subunit [Rhodothermales bacterium]|nr:phage terminase large subunit [Rhodothermales bacterium]
MPAAAASKLRAQVTLPSGRVLRRSGPLADQDRARLEAELELRRRSAGRAARDPLGLRAFLRESWSVLEPGVPFSDSWHVGAICEFCEAVTGGEIKDGIISMPPRSLKSRTIAVAWPAWEWAERRPQTRWLFASYSHTLSKRDSVECRRLIQSPWYRSRYAHVFSLARDQNEKMRFENSRRGVRVATSVGGATTGEGGDRLVIDDPHNVRDVTSEAKRRAVISWHDRAWTSRRNSPETSSRLVVAQRTHALDLIGHLLAKGGYEHLTLPQEYNPRRSRVVVMKWKRGEEGRRLRDGEGAPVPEREWKDPRQEEGALLHPARIGEEENEKLRRDLGGRDFEAQYNQNPTPDSGNIVDPSWWRFYDARPAGLESVVISWDCAFKDTQASSYVCGQVWGARGAARYLLEQVKRRMSYTQTRRAVRQLAARWPAYTAILVEEKANGVAIIDDLRDTVSGIIPVNPTESKTARLHAQAPQIEAGNVFLPTPTSAAGHGWVEEYVANLALFPDGDSSDEGDATSQALMWLRTRGERFEALHG